ncbi:OadG family protein [Clostridium sp. D2Q-11]|uniref:OadG family protein n=1 Tax=Anaeromonas frigoriresistens TaxID=2683708 RepID=A0A942USN5_9FIRM|nr:OadG family transporter subunit [Anaeromonas frigoriresistens]MBS4538413.1 OadG family protein [Anaeromonas frigoriresistens]
MITMSKALTITVFSMTLVFITLTMIFFILKSFKTFIYKEEVVDKKVPVKANIKKELEIEEEDRVVVSLAASIIAGEGKVNPNFHISSIKRIK